MAESSQAQGIFSDLIEGISTWFRDEVWSMDTGIEIVLIMLAATLAWPVAVYLRKSIDRLRAKNTRLTVLNRFWETLSEVSFPLAWLAVQWVVVVTTTELEVRNATLTITTSLLTAWVIVRLATIFIPNPFWSKTLAVTAFLIAALNIVGLLDQTIAVLDEAAFSLGQFSLSALTIMQGLVALGVLLWASTVVAQIVEGRLKASPNLTPSIQVLSAKLLRIGLGTMAFLVALAIVGVDLTALAVFGGAIGVGLGFGLQKIFANLISGFILLLDKSIKPGDVIAVPDYFGRVDSLGARYVSVTTRDGIEHLIPNEELITTRVENWSHSNNLLRLRKQVGVHYKSDVHKAIELCLEAARETPRILDEPKTACLMRDFGESSVDLEIRYWINDPMNGRANVTSELLLRVWDKFHANDIEIPYPQRDLHLRSSALKVLADASLEDAAG